MHRSALALVALATVACSHARSAPAPAPAPPAPAPVVTPPPPPPPPPPPASAEMDPTGTYQLQISFGGTPLAVALELYKENGRWYGTAGNPTLGMADVSSVVIDGRKLRVTLVAQNGGPTFVMSLDVKTDNSVTGTWEGNNDGSPITGRKTSAP